MHNKIVCGRKIQISFTKSKIWFSLKSVWIKKYCYNIKNMNSFQFLIPQSLRYCETSG
jgi:hypothetical protein